MQPVAAGPTPSPREVAEMFSTAPLVGTFSLDCSIPTQDLFDGNVGVDGIPSLENPGYASVADADSELLPDSMRVSGVELDGRPLAVPHNLAWTDFHPHTELWERDE